MEIGEAIKKVRTELGMSIRQFADDIGTDKSTIRSYEIGEKAPNWKMILRIIDSCGTDWLMELLEEMR